MCLDNLKAMEAASRILKLKSSLVSQKEEDQKSLYESQNNRYKKTQWLDRDSKGAT